MNNPFEIISNRLSNIEEILLSIKHDNPVITKELDQKEHTFNISELADYLKVSKPTIHAYKNRNIFPFYQTGRTVYFKKSEVDKALSSSKKKGAFK